MWMLRILKDPCPTCGHLSHVWQDAWSFASRNAESDEAMERYALAELWLCDTLHSSEYPINFCVTAAEDQKRCFFWQIDWDNLSRLILIRFSSPRAIYVIYAEQVENHAKFTQHLVAPCKPAWLNELGDQNTAANSEGGKCCDSRKSFQHPSLAVFSLQTAGSTDCEADQGVLWGRGICQFRVAQAGAAVLAGVWVSCQVFAACSAPHDRRFVLFWQTQLMPGHQGSLLQCGACVSAKSSQRKTSKYVASAEKKKPGFVWALCHVLCQTVSATSRVRERICLNAMCIL